MRILICDDEPFINKQLQEYISRFFRKRNISAIEYVCFTSGEEILADTGRKDIVFLDIEMPGVDGIFVGNQLKKENPEVIIFVITSYIEYLDKAMRFHVFRYLSKPLDKNRLYDNLQDALECYSKLSHKVTIATKTNIYTLPSSSLLAVEAHGRNSIVYTAKQSYESICSIQYWLDTLPKSCFVQTHRSYIVNLAHVSMFDHAIIHFFDSTVQAYLSRRNYKMFKDAYLIYIEGVR